MIEFVVDRHVNELSYGGLTELSGFFRDRLGMAMFENDEQEKLLRFFFEVRNINVHNGGIANALFSSRVGEFDYFAYSEGSRIHLDLDRISILSTNAMNVARSVDAKISAKFKIKRKRRATWLAAAENVK